MQYLILIVTKNSFTYQACAIQKAKQSEIREEEKLSP